MPDPFGGGRFSGLIPLKTGVELIGGPYLKANLTTNFTQFGGGRLFGRDDWDAEFFKTYARLYRPGFILCWSPHAVRMVSEHGDLFTILAREGPFVFARVDGFGGDAIRGSARVEAAPGRLTVSEMTADLDGYVVLRYHSVPSLQARPAAAVDEEFAEGDPVPFVRIKPDAGMPEVTLEMAPPLWTP
jgi:hypothetical protein